MLIAYKKTVLLVSLLLISLGLYFMITYSNELDLIESQRDNYINNQLTNGFDNSKIITQVTKAKTIQLLSGLTIIISTLIIFIFLSKTITEIGDKFNYKTIICITANTLVVITSFVFVAVLNKIDTANSNNSRLITIFDYIHRFLPFISTFFAFDGILPKLKKTSKKI